MNSGSLSILQTALLMIAVSILYFLSLVFQLPVAVVVVLSLTAALLFYQYCKPLRQYQTSGIHEKPDNWLAIIVLAAGLAILIYQSALFGTKDGDWDAWAIWNLHAVYLSSPEQWQLMLKGDTDPHPDYPLALPGLIAFLWRIFHTQSHLIPFAVSAVPFLLMPALIFLEIKNRSLLVAIPVLTWFALDDCYAKHALSQCADTFLGFLLVCSLVSIHHYENSKNQKYLLLAGIFCGGCIWTKNEGMLLAVIFVLFYSRIIWSGSRGKWFMAGIAGPMLCYGLFKLGYSPANDLVAMRRKITIGYLADKSRYAIIWQALRQQFKEQYFLHKIVAFFYAIVLSLKHQWPHREMLLVLSCFAAYLAVYLFTPMDLQWHINTSFDRLLHQLAPVFIYAVALQFSGSVRRSYTIS